MNQKLLNLKNKLENENSLLPETQRHYSSLNGRYRGKTENRIKEASSGLKQLKSEYYNRSNTLQPSIMIESEVSSNEDSASSTKIIGITGSQGKTSTAFILHENLKALGYKSVLYSSASIDSPASYIPAGEPCEVPLKDTNTLLDIVDETIAYGADFLVLEVNESAIAKGLVKDIPFDVRALTNIIPKHNEDMYTDSEYVELKKSFFKDIVNVDECTCVVGMTGCFNRMEFNELMSLNDCLKVTYGSKYVCERFNADYTNIDVLLYAGENRLSSMNGLDMNIRVKNSSYNFTCNMILPQNALNFSCVIAILDTLNLFDPESFQRCIKNIVVPGREEIINWRGRKIVIGHTLMPALEVFSEYKARGEINNIKVVRGSMGLGFKNWIPELKSDLFLKMRKKMRSDSFTYLSKHADYVYITSEDPAMSDPLAISKELQSYLNNEIGSKIILDRKEAVYCALAESEEGDLIYVSGRGNRKLFCKSENEFEVKSDKQIIHEILSDMGW